MDERLSGWEDRLRTDLAASVRDVRADDGLLVAARAGGRRRLRRRRALVTLPAAVVVTCGAVGGAVWAGLGRQAAPRPVTPASSAVPTPVPTTSAAPAPETSDDLQAVDVFLETYTYDDAVELGQIWNVDSWEAKIRGGRALENGLTLPISR